MGFKLSGNDGQFRLINTNNNGQFAVIFSSVTPTPSIQRKYFNFNIYIMVQSI